MPVVTTPRRDPVDSADGAEPADASAAADRPLLCCTHHHPPLTPAGFYRDRRKLFGGLVIAFGFLAVAAMIASSWLLLTWDEPVQRFVEQNRTGALDTFFRAVSRLGSQVVVFALGAVFAAVAWTRCRAVAVAIVVSMLARPVIELAIKELVDRSRPDLDRLVLGTGPSFPSGHVMASVALWGLVPLVVGLFVRSRAIWWASAAVAGTIVVLVAASRVYLGVHWLSDVTAGLILGSFYLLGVEAVLGAAHRRTGCGRDSPPATGPRMEY